MNSVRMVLSPPAGGVHPLPSPAKALHRWLESVLSKAAEVLPPDDPPLPLEQMTLDQLLLMESALSRLLLLLGEIEESTSGEPVKPQWYLVLRLERARIVHHIDTLVEECDTRPILAAVEGLS